MHLPHPARPLVAGLIGALACAATHAADEPVTVPAAAAASAPAEPADATTSTTLGLPTLGDLPRRIETTLDSWQQFLDDLLVDALGPNPERRYRVFGQRKTVDLGRRWTLALDERQTGLLTSAGTGIPVAGRPSRTWELLHQGEYNAVRFYNQRDGSGHENGGSLIRTLAPRWSWHTHGRHLKDEAVGVVRTDAQTGLRYGPRELWLEGFVRHAQLEDTFGIEGWASPKPSANFGGLQAQWEALPGLSFAAQHQRAIRPRLSEGDERLAGPRTEFGADYRPGGAWSGSRVYWREATELGLLSSSGVEERSTYRRVVGAEMPEGSPDGLVYTQVRHQSLLDDDDALLVLGWRHTMQLAPTWRAQSLIETGIPVAGDNAVRSTTFDLRLQHNDFPRRAFATELQAVRTPLKGSAFASIDYTQRLTRNSLFVTRASVTGVRPYAPSTDEPLNAGEWSLGWGWQEPDERRFSTFLRLRLLAREALNDGVAQPDVADRRARIVQGEFDWQQTEPLHWLLRGARRWDHDDAFNAGQRRTTNLVVLRPTLQLAERWRLSVHAAQWRDSALPSRRGYGAELSVQMKRKLVLALGYNPKGIDDGELAADDRLGKGVQLRLYIPSEAVLKHWLKASASEGS